MRVLFLSMNHVFLYLGAILVLPVTSAAQTSIRATSESATVQRGEVEVHAEETKDGASASVRIETKDEVKTIEAVKVEEEEPVEQIDPPSLQLDAGPEDTDLDEKKEETK